MSCPPEPVLSAVEVSGQRLLVTLNEVKGPVKSFFRNTRIDWMFQGFAPQHDEDAGRTRHPDAKRKGPVKSCITKKRLVLFARDACCWSVDVLFFLIIS